MNKATKAVLAATALVIGSSSLMAAPAHRYAHLVQPNQDKWVQTIHLESTAVPAKQFFEQMQRDGE